MAGVTPDRPRRFDLTPLAHPLWWGALALLVVNDHLLKGRGVVPSWLTGKLSDFAFLIVAPMLATALLPRALRWRRTLAVTAVVGVFVAAELSRAVSDAIIATAGWVGIRWQLWPDPTDLIALAVLPLTVHLLRAPAPAWPQRFVAVHERAGVLVGALACVATSAPHGDYPHHPFLLNAAPNASATVRVTWVLQSFPACESARTVAAGLTPGDLDDPRDLDLARGQVAPLDGPLPAGAPPAGICATTLTETYSSCLAALLESPPAAPVLMVARRSWTQFDEDTSCKPQLDPTKDPGPDAVRLMAIDGQLAFVAGAKIDLAVVDADAIRARTPAANGCRDVRAAYRALLGAPQPCATDADCAAVDPVRIPGEPGECVAYINSGSASALAKISADWSSGCITDPGKCFGQPAACHGGTCGPACPGVDVPLCPYACGERDVRTGSSCWADFQCRAPDGNFCSCVNHKIICAPPAPISATCPLTCLATSGG